MDQVFDAAVIDFFEKRAIDPLLINNKYGPVEELPLDIYFRDENNLNGLELYALSLCKGSVLDIGAGVGSLSIILQNKGIKVEALENSEICCEIMRSRGVEKVTFQDFYSISFEHKYDTLLLMMNGLGICQTLDNLPVFFTSLNRLLKSDGQVLFDSSDVHYLYDDGIPEDTYFGEIDYQYEYRGQKGSWFKWLYVDIETLKQEAKKHGFQLQVLSEDANGQYLGRLIRL
jgi:SAM-dependent methyltransferase